MQIEDNKKASLYSEGSLVHRSIQLPNFLYAQLAQIEKIKYLEF